MFIFGFIWAGLIGAIFLGVIVFLVIVLSKNIKNGKKPAVYHYNGHELQVFVTMRKVTILYDGKLIDEIALSISQTAGARFNEFLDDVSYKINIGYSGITPSVVVFANNEKLEPIK